MKHRLLEQLTIAAAQEIFRATDVWSEFVIAEDHAPGAKTIIVDNYGPYPSDSIKEAVYAQLREAFASCEFVDADQIDCYGTLPDAANK
jgi:hypothetical protein